MINRTKQSIVRYNQIIFLGLTFLLMGISIFSHSPIEILQLILIVLWYLSGRKFVEADKILIAFSALFVLLIPFFLMFSRDFASENFAVLVFYILIFVVIDRAGELLSRKPE